MSLPVYDGQVLDYKDINRNLIHEAHEQLQLSVSTSSSSVSFTNNKTFIIVRNVGSNTAYVNAGSSASTSDFPVAENETVTFYGSVGTISAITSTGTADLRIWGFGDG